MAVEMKMKLKYTTLVHFKKTKTPADGNRGGKGKALKRLRHAARNPVLNTSHKEMLGMGTAIEEARKLALHGDPGWPGRVG